MKNATSYFLLLILLLLSKTINSQNSAESDFSILKGPYLGQELPTTEPMLFAPGIISNGLHNRDVSISKDGKEMYFGLHSSGFKYSTILVSRLENGVWTAPEAVSFARDPRYSFLEPALSPDDSKIFFLSNLPKDSTDTPGDEDIWVADRTEDGWGEPYNLGEPVNTSGNEFYPSFTRDGTLYFTRAAAGERIHYIYRSRQVNGSYTEPEKLPEQVNCGTNRFNAFVAFDESYVIVPAAGMEDALGGVDYYIVFRNEDDSWSEPKNMGPKINSQTGAEWSLSVSPDQKYIFFMASKDLPDSKQPESLSFDFFQDLQTLPQNGSSDIYWIDAKIIEDLRP